MSNLRSPQFYLAFRRCRRCQKWHYLALQGLISGALHRFSPSIYECYACQLSDMIPEQRIRSKVRYAKIWRLATDEPLPEEIIV